MKGVGLLFLTLLLFGRASGLDIEWVGSGSAISTGSATLSISKPAGTSAGDLILIQAAYTTATGTITIPTGFTAYVNTGATALEYTFCYRMADGTEGSSFSLSSNNTRDWIGSIAVYRNVNPGSPFEDIGHVFSASSSGDTAFTAPAVTSQNGEGVHLIFGMSKHDGTPTSISPPSGMTRLTDTVESTRMIIQAAQVVSASGSTGAKSISFAPAIAGAANNRRYFVVSLILRPLRILYSYQSGNYDSSSTWTKDPSVSLLMPTGGLTPLAGDSLVIKNGSTITLSADKTNTGIGLMLEEGSVFDLQSFTLEGLNSINGKGRLRSSRTTGSIAYFPDALSSAGFLGTDGGILEYYCASGVTLNTGVTACRHLELKSETSGTTIYTLAASMTIYGNLTLSRTGSALSRLVVGNNTTTRTLTIDGNATVNAGCEWQVGAFDGDHIININGNLNNYGSLRFTNQITPNYATEPTTGTAILTFTGATNTSFLCYGQTDLYRLIVNKGTDQTYILSVESNDSTHFELYGTNDLSNNPTTDPNPVVRKALYIQNGTLKLNENIYIPCLTTAGADFFIPQSAGLWINGAHVVSTTGTGTSTGITVIGLLRMSSGRIETGTSTGILYRVNATLTIEGGYLHAAQLRPAATGAHYLAYNQSGGHVVIDGTTENTGFARFSLLYTDCSFTMSGGLLEIKYPVNRTGTAINLIEINSSTSNFSSTGGQVLAISDRTGELAHVFVSGWLYDLELEDAGGNAFVSHGALSVSNSLLLDQGNPSLDMDNFDLNLNGNLNIISGASLDMGIGTLTFGGSDKQLFTLDGSLTGNLQNFTIDKSDTLELAGSVDSIIVNGAFSLLDGIFNDGGKTLDLRGDLDLSSIHTGTGKILLSTATSRNLSGDGNGAVHNLEFNSSGDATVTFSCNLKIQGELEFIGTAQRVLDLVSYNLTFDSFATVVNPGNNRFVRFNGIQSAGGLTKIYSNDSFAFPIGSGTGATYDYTPARIYFTSTPTTYGSITVKPVASEHLAVTENGRSLTYYWKTSSSDFTLGSAEVVQEYDYLAGDVVTGGDVSEGGYRPARFDLAALEWVVGSATTVDTTNQSISFSGITFPEIDGEYTAGDNDALNPFGQIEVYYSRVNNGDWADVNTWTTNPDHTTVSPPGTIPNANTIMRIGNGSSILHTIEVNTNGGNLGILTIFEGSTLDLNQTTGHDFSIVRGASADGKGTIRMDRSGTSYEFPAGDFGDFLAAGGGGIEYYNSTTSAVTLPAALSTYNKLIINAQNTGNINFPPVDLTLYDSLLIKSTGSGACYLNPTNVAFGDIIIEKSLVISDGALEIRNPGTSAERYFHIKGDLRLAAGTSFIVQSNSTLAHTLELEGDLVNEGTLDFYATNSRHVILNFTGSDTAYFTGNNVSASTEIYQVIVNKGTDPTSMLVLDVAGTLTTRPSGWLTLTNGTFRFAKTGATLLVWNNAVVFDIPASSALSINNSTATLDLAQSSNNGADLLLSGRLEVLAGTVNVGNIANNRNNDIEYASSGFPEIILSGGTLNVNGQIRRNTTTTAGSLYYSQSGGSVVNVYGRNNDDTRGMLEVLNTGSFFGMSDTSKLYLARGGAVTFPDLLLNPTSSSVSGGTIYFQPLSPTTGNQSFTLNSSIPLYSMSIMPVAALTSTVTLTTNGLALLGNLQIDADGTLVTDDLALAIEGRFEKSGTYTGGNTLLSFTGTNSAIQGDFSSQTIYQLAVDTNSVLSLSGSGTSLQITSQLTINSGAVLHDSSHLIDLKGAMTNNGEHRSLSNSASNTLQFTGSAAQTVSGSGIFGNLVVNNGYTVNLQGATQINRQLTLTNGSLNIGEYRLTLEETATVSGNFGASQHIRTNGVLSDAGVMKKCPSGANDLYFPLGLSGKYTPARINITSSDAAGTVTIRLVNAKHPSTRLLGDSQLNLYWSADTTGFNNLTVTHTYEYVNADVGGPEATYVSGRYVSPNWTPVLGISGTVDTTSNTITLSNVAYINGSFTAGSPGEFGSGNTYYSRKTSGDWDDLDMWSITGHNGAALSSASELPSGSPIIIASGDTVLVSGNSKLAETITLLGQAVLDLGNTYAHNLGVVSGTGTLRVKATGGGQFLFPAGTFTAFSSASGGTVEFYGATNGTLPTRTEYNNLLFSDAATKTQSNVNVTVNGLFHIQAGVLSNTSFNKNITLKKNWVNDAGATGYVPGQGKVLFASDSAQSLDGISRFYSLEFSGAGSKTLLDSISVGYQLLMNGGLVYLGSNTLFIDSVATSSGRPSNTAKVIQNGSGRIVKRSKNTSPAFIFPKG
ncbi:MAG: beta strand repeat-containing protein, partial [Bacteroidia bacterium]